FPVQGFKIDSAFRSAKAGGHLENAVAAGMRDGDAKPDPCAHGLFPMAQRTDRILPMGGVKLTLLNQTIDDFLDGLPPIGGDHLRNNLILGE
ncbi:MAG: hypothetical protein WCI42_01140, partial [Verrucomicrobiota bacterium]